MELRFRVSPAGVGRLLGWVILGLAAAHIATRVPVFLWDAPPGYYPLRLFDFNEEGNVPALFSGALLLADALLLALAARADREAGGSERFWLLLSAVFALLALDEWLTFHEYVGRYVRHALGLGRGVFFYAWVIPYGLATAALGLASLGFLSRLPARSRNLFLVSGAVYVTGALVLEMAGAVADRAWGSRSLPFALIALGEETLEKAGAGLFLCSLLDHFGRAWPGFAVRVGVKE